jgi:hypothetical protein
MTLGWFDTSDLSRFASSLAEELVRITKSSVARGEKASRAAERTNRLVEKAVAYRQTLGINVYKKAKLVQLLRDELRTRGVGEAEIRQISDALLLGRFLGSKEEGPLH